MATTVRGLTERVPQHILHAGLHCGSIRPGARLWRNIYCPLNRRKQELKDLHCQQKGIPNFRVKSIAFYHQKEELQSIRKARMMKTALLSVIDGKDPIVARNKQEQNQVINAQLQEFIHETEKQPLPLASNAEEKEKVSNERDEMESNVDSMKKVEVVYTRRSRRNSVAKQASVVKESLSHMSDGDSPKLSATMAEDVPLQGKDLMEKVAISDSGKSSRKRKLAAKASRHMEVETATGSERHDIDGLVKKEDPWTLLVHKKVQSEWSAYNPATMRRHDPPSGALKLLSWNVNGLRALLKGKGGKMPGSPILELAQKENFDVLCLQETKLQEKDVITIKESLLPGYENSFWSCSTTKLGYSGTAVISRIKPLSITYGLGLPNHDNEGRIITLEFGNFYLVAGYVPNSGQKLERLAYRTQDWDSSLGNFLKDLEKRKPVILTGDLNCAHQEIDIYNPDGNRRSAGYTDEERTSFEENYLKRGLVDTFRRQHPHAVAYTYWGYRTAARPKNQGWRLDYYLASDALLEHVYDSFIIPDVEGSDHCPVGLILKA